MLPIRPSPLHTPASPAPPSSVLFRTQCGRGQPRKPSNDKLLAGNSSGARRPVSGQRLSILCDLRDMSDSLSGQADARGSEKKRTNVLAHARARQTFRLSRTVLFTLMLLLRLARLQVHLKFQSGACKDLHALPYIKYFITLSRMRASR